VQYQASVLEAFGGEKSCCATHCAGIQAGEQIGEWPKSHALKLTIYFSHLSRFHLFRLMLQLELDDWHASRGVANGASFNNLSVNLEQVTR